MFVRAVYLLLLIFLIVDTGRVESKEILLDGSNFLNQIKIPEITLGNSAWVGNGSGCTHNTLQSAINDPSINFIQLAKNVTENIVINKSLTILGGYTSCGASQGNTLSSIDGSSDITLPTIRIVETGGNPNTVQLLRLSITGGTGGVLNAESGGGIYIYGGQQEVILGDSQVISNFSSNVGGGISINDFASLLLLDSLVAINQAVAKGGGVYCDRSYIKAIGKSPVAFNKADGPNGLGGGFYLNACDLDYEANESSEGIIQLNGISKNEAEISGGGIYANNYQMEVAGVLDYFNGDIKIGKFDAGSELANEPPVVIANNGILNPSVGNNSTSAIAVQNPIWVYCSNPNAINSVSNCLDSDVATLNLQNVTIEDNYGGVYTLLLRGLATINLHCEDYQNKLCNLISENENVSISGGLIRYAHQGLFTESTVSNFNHRIENTKIQHNHGVYIFSGNHTAHFTEPGGFLNSDWESNLRVERSLIIENNSLHNIAFAEARAEMYFTHVTIADNTFVQNTSSAIFNNSLADSTRPNSNFKINNSIVEVTGAGGLTEGADEFDFDCLLHTFGVTTPNTNITRSLLVPEAGLGFADPVNDDYHLSSTSPAIDFCNAQSFYANVDIDGEVNGWDMPLVNNLHGTHDLGADEYYDNLGLVFADLELSLNVLTTGIYQVGDVLDFELVFKNNGPNDSLNVNFQTVMENFEFYNAWSSVGGLCQQPNCFISSVPNGHQETISFSTAVQATGTIALDIIVTSQAIDSPSSNNSVHFERLVLFDPDLIFENGFEATATDGSDL
ncbi:hypothetical protein [Marinicella sp. W31]|uniref:hypothetical protein n=1 Tax=Marinicella sp. W31 TaxID=3023713 RepID=UPI0037570D2C